MNKWKEWIRIKLEIRKHRKGITECARDAHNSGNAHLNEGLAKIAIMHSNEISKLEEELSKLWSR